MLLAFLVSGTVKRVCLRLHALVEAPFDQRDERHIDPLEMNLQLTTLCLLVGSTYAGYLRGAPLVETGSSTQFRNEDPWGNYNFGYDEDHTSGGSFRRETGNALGAKMGSYGLRDADGRVRVVSYVADEHGFRASISTNEPGTVPSTPADVAIGVPAAAAPPPPPVPVAAPAPVAYPAPAPVALKAAPVAPAAYPAPAPVVHRVAPVAPRPLAYKPAAPAAPAAYAPPAPVAFKAAPVAPAAYAPPAPAAFGPAPAAAPGYGHPPPVAAPFAAARAPVAPFAHAAAPVPPGHTFIYSHHVYSAGPAVGAPYAAPPAHPVHPAHPAHPAPAAYPAYSSPHPGPVAHAGAPPSFGYSHKITHPIGAAYPPKYSW